ncbi:DUF1045 domain-containing protein [Jannaschia sp. 2305UL9-9]|uniref:DUF1045 domain-containing protein n=1 Tax=Jannaschia sp. 2305UL9-9 TaxID=3121638 RepID=UPI00352867CC
MSRYAIYCLPEGEFGAQGAAWLGWDAAAGRALPVPEGRAAWVAQPRKYGFHATLKPPFRLATGRDRAGLEKAVAALAARTAPGRADRLNVAAFGGFVAFRPSEGHDFARIAAACVMDLDAFRAPAPPKETLRRRAAGLSRAQEAMLLRWGYPHVLDQFRFHITLSGRVSDAAEVLEAARAHFDPPAPFMLDALALCEEGQDGTFTLLHRYPLTGVNAPSA